MQKIIVADSCSLILLAKSSMLKYLTESFPIIIAKSVLNDVVNKELLKRFADAKIIHDYVLNKKIEVLSVKSILPTLPVSIDKGELESIFLSMQTANSVLATDDGKAIKACKYLKIPFIITPRLIVELYYMEKIDLNKARFAIEKIRIAGRYSPDIIASAIMELEVCKDAKNSNNKGSRRFSG